MLRFLSIRHLAVIDRIELEFGPGLTVLTGETGAGKSILARRRRPARRRARLGRARAHGRGIGVGRSGLRCPRRTRNHRPARGVGAGPKPRVRRRRARHERRAPRARRARSSTCTVSTSIRCCSIRRRTSTCSTRTPGSSASAQRSRTRLSTWQALKPERERLLAGQRESASRAEFVAFQLAEIDRVNPKPGEDDELAATRQVLANADKLQRLCAEAYQTLYEGDQAALSALGVVWRKVGELAAIDERFAPHLAARDIGQAGARGPRLLSPLVRRGHRRRARRGCRRSRTGSRRSSVSRRSTARRLRRSSRRSEELRRELDVAGAWVRTIGRARPRRSASRAKRIVECGRAAVGAASVGRARLQPDAGEVARRSRDGADALRGAFHDRPRPRPTGPSAASNRLSSTSRRIRARI